MLQSHITSFLDYCRLANFSQRSQQALAIRLHEFRVFLKIRSVELITDITYLDLSDFVGEFKRPSVHVKKSRVWTLRQFYHFLSLHGHVAENIAAELPYPKIEKTVPAFLTQEQMDRLVRYFSDQADGPFGLRNLVIFLLLATLGLRTSTLCMIDVDDVDIGSGLLWVTEKGRRCRSLALPKALCVVLSAYIGTIETGPLLTSKRAKRICPRTIQEIFRKAADTVDIENALHPRLFRHTAATHLNRAAGIEITQEVLGHSLRKNTFKYTHLNPDQFAAFMNQHPYNQEVPCRS